MMDRLKYIAASLSIALCFFTFNLHAQNITGTWIGKSSQEYVKFVIIHTSDSVYGYTYDEGPGFCKATFAGRYDDRAAFLKGEGVDLLMNSGNHGLSVYRLNYSRDGQGEYLKGPVVGKSKDPGMISVRVTGILQLTKYSAQVDTIDFMRDHLVRLNKISPNAKRDIKEPVGERLKVNEKVSSVQVPKHVPDIKKRLNKVVQTIYTDADSLKMFVYDNGTIDDDTVTVMVDGIVVADRLRISAIAKEISFPLFRTAMKHSIILYANNLGSIPPNTALILIHAGRKRYELRASYDLQTNAEIIIQSQR